ncbi:diguanylate cyclase [Duganella sp. Leaf126]|nr:diguanylate cyclase [Duganella sp. Leaf126]
MAPVGLVQLSADGTIQMLNPLSAQLLLPLCRDGELTNLFEGLAPVVPDLRQQCAAFDADQGQICDATRLFLHADHGSNGPQVLSLSMLKLGADRLMVVLSDITLQERRERQLRKTDAWLNAIMSNITDYALLSLDGQGRVEAWNDSIARVTGYDAGGIVGRGYDVFYPPESTTDAHQLDRLREADDNGWILDEGMRLRADGSRFWASIMIAPLPGRCADAPPCDDEPAYCMIIRDISDKQDISEGLRKATFSDYLTGLANRRAFFEAAELELMRRRKAARPVSLLMVDADHFKAVNDCHGHPAGDAVLRHLAATMKKACRQVDIVARIGGEEFAILLPSVALADALAVAERLRALVQREPASYEQASIAYAVSIGVATMGDGIEDLDQLIKRADQALYAAKRGGRNRVAAWQASGMVAGVTHGQ